MNTMAKSEIGRTLLDVPVAPLQELFLLELANMYDAEKQLARALPLVAKAAKSDDLKTLVNLHLKETKGHVKCIEQVALSLGEDLNKTTCRAMKGLINEVVAVMLKKIGSRCLDASLIVGAQKIENYEIAAYGALCNWADQLGYNHEAALLSSTLGQEKIADALLTGLAKKSGSLAVLVNRVSLKMATAPRREDGRGGEI